MYEYSIVWSLVQFLCYVFLDLDLDCTLFISIQQKMSGTGHGSKEIWLRADQWKQNSEKSKIANNWIPPAFTLRPSM